MNHSFVPKDPSWTPGQVAFVAGALLVLLGVVSGIGISWLEEYFQIPK